MRIEPSSLNSHLFIRIFRSKGIMWICIISCSLLIGSSFYYRLSPTSTIKSLARESALILIRSAVSIYDPTEIISTRLTPASCSDLYITRDSKKDTFYNIVSSMFPNSTITIFGFNNKPLVRSRYRFGYQTLSDEHLRGLARKYHLYDILSASSDDFDLTLRLADWVKSQWIHGTSGDFDPNNFNSDAVLEEASNGSQFWCHVYSMTFIQLATSLGLQARLISLSKDGYSRDHAVAEVWSNKYQKWIMIDVDFNIYYEKNEKPLNVLEIHNAFMNGETNLLQVKRGRTRPIPELERRIPTLFIFYRYFDVDMRNDWITNHYFPGHPSRSDKATLWWQDNCLPPVLNFKTAVNNVDDMYWDINRVHMNFIALSHGAILVQFDTVTPNFNHFSVSVNDSFPYAVESCFFEWKLKQGDNSIAISPVNSLGQSGIESNICVSIN